MSLNKGSNTMRQGRGGGSSSDPYAFDALDQPSHAAPAPSRPRQPGHAFAAELDVTELNERGRPGTPWTAKGRELSRGSLVFMSRRMSHVGRLLLIAVHLIDDRPVPLYGRVVECEYEADGLHRVTIEFQPLPDSEVVRTWVESRGPKGPAQRPAA